MCPSLTYCIFLFDCTGLCKNIVPIIIYFYCSFKRIICFFDLLYCFYQTFSAGRDDGFSTVGFYSNLDFLFAFSIIDSTTFYYNFFIQNVFNKVSATYFNLQLFKVFHSCTSFPQCSTICMFK